MTGAVSSSSLSPPPPPPRGLIIYSRRLLELSLWHQKANEDEDTFGGAISLLDGKKILLEV